MIILAGIERGLSLAEMKRLSLGQVVDFVVDYNRRQKEAEERAERRSKAKHYRLATKDEVDALLKG